MRRWFVPLLLLACSVYLGLASPGFFEADELAHFLKAREMLHDWTGVLDIWGRPACTGLFGLAAAVGGLADARMFAVLITGLTAMGAVALYEALLPWIEGPQEAEASQVFRGNAAGWIWVLMYAQPLLLMNSFTVMTEMLLAAAWVWALVMLLRRRMVVAGVLIGLGGLARPEGWIAIAAWPVFLMLWRRVCVARAPGLIGRWRAVGGSIVAATLPMIAWWAAGVFAFHSARWMIDRFPWQGHSQYGRTGLLFVGSSLVALAVWMWIPMLVGAVSLWLRRAGPAIALLVVPTAGFFLLHATLGTMGLMGSMSLPRYFICVSPEIAVLTLLGLQTLAARGRRPRLLRKMVIFAVIMPAFLLVSLGQLPVPKSADIQQLDIVISDFERRVPREQWAERLIAGHPYVYFRTGVSMGSDFAAKIFHPEAIRSAPVDTYIISDSRLWDREHRPTQQDLIEWGYQLIAVPPQPPAMFDLSALGPAVELEMPVGLWVKVK